jgi:hypothetical protein
MRLRLRGQVQEIYTRSGHVSGERVMSVREISDADTGNLVLRGKSIPLNKHAKEIGVCVGDWIEFEGDVVSYDGKTQITQTRSVRRTGNYWPLR